MVPISEVIDDVVENAPQHIVWLDFETTGLSYREHTILEIGCVVTDMELKIVRTFHELHLPGADSTFRIKDPFVQHMHSENGLLADLVDRGETWEVVHKRFKGFLEQFPAPVILAGHGVSHMEWPWIQEHFPSLIDRFMYYTYDVSVVHRMVKSVRPDKVLPKNESHRAMMDVYAALMEWKYLSDLMKHGMF